MYHALKAFGQILKIIFILRVIDEPVLRMSIEKVLSGIEHVHAFTRAVSVGNPREFLQAEKEDQEMALLQKLAEIGDPAKREELLQAMAHGWLFFRNQIAKAFNFPFIAEPAMGPSRFAPA